MKCSEKKVYFDRKRAKVAAKKFKLLMGKQSFHCYICPECGFYHITKMPRDQQRSFEAHQKNKLNE